MSAETANEPERETADRRQADELATTAQIGNAIVRLQAEERLRQSQARQQAILDTIPDPAWLVDRHGCLLAVNAAWCRFRGLEEKEALGKKSFDLLPPELAERVEREKGEVLTTGAQRCVEELQTDSDGRAVWFETVRGPLYDDRGAIVGMVGIARDITARKQTEEQLRAVNAAMEQRMSQLRAMAAELSHVEQRERRRLAQVLHDNLQQLLAATRLKVARLRQRVQPGDDLHRIADELDSLLDQCVNESRSLTMELSPPVLYEQGLAAALDWLARRFAEQHDLAVRAVADRADDPADEDLRAFLFQAVRELLFNVVKHAAARQACVAMTRDPEGRLRIEVQDDGVGCDPAQLAGQAIADGGFGLFSIRERLGPWGGCMEVDSSPGQGMRVAIAVPLEGSSAAVELSAPHYGRRQRTGRRLA